MKDFKSKHIAIVGVSSDSTKYGNRIFCDMKAAGYRVDGINPKGGEVAGKPLYKSISELDIPPDIVVTVVPPAVTERVVEECQRNGVKEIWMQPGSESDAAIRKAQEYGLRLTHNTCVMVSHGIW